jgi:hypothetical protein
MIGGSVVRRAAEIKQGDDGLVVTFTDSRRRDGRGSGAGRNRSVDASSCCFR